MIGRLLAQARARERLSFLASRTTKFAAERFTQSIAEELTPVRVHATNGGMIPCPGSK